MPPLRGICRAVKVGLKWLLGFIVNCFETLPDHLPDHLNVQPQDTAGTCPAARSQAWRGNVPPGQAILDRPG
jgi:hypothetical protein